MGKKLQRGPKFGKEMSLEELRKFVEEADVMGFGDNVAPKIRAAWKGGIRSIELDEEKVVTPLPPTRDILP